MWGKIIFLKKQITYLKLFKRKTKKMKKSKVITSFVCVLCSLFSCSSDDIENISNNSSNEEIIKVAYIDDNGNITNSGEVKNQVLCFDSEANYNEFIKKLKNLSNEEKAHTFKKLGFTNLNELAKIADTELDSIGENSNNEAEFRTKYNSYLNKYAEVFVTNKYDSLDLSLYIPASSDEDIDPYIVSASKTIVINGNARKISFLNEMNSVDERMYGTQKDVQIHPLEINENRNASTTRSVVGTGTNGVICSKLDCGMKVIFSCEVLIEGTVQFHFGAQKKMWYGWTRTNREFYFAPSDNISGFFIGQGLATLSNKNSYLIKLGKHNFYGLTCNSCGGKKFCNIGSEEFPVGRIQGTPVNGNSNILHYNMQGSITIWMMCHGEKFSYEEACRNIENGFFAEYPCVVCSINLQGYCFPYYYY